jgi:hypothetical protein
LAETLGSGILGNRFGFVLRVLLLEVLGADRAEERVLADGLFSFWLARGELSVGDDFAGLEYFVDLERGELGFRLKRRWTFLISSTNSAFFMPCQPGTP